MPFACYKFLQAYHFNISVGSVFYNIGDETKEQGAQFLLLPPESSFSPYKFVLISYCTPLVVEVSYTPVAINVYQHDLICIQLLAALYIHILIFVAI